MTNGIFCGKGGLIRLSASRPWLLMVLSSLLYPLCFPDYDYEWLAWIAYVPLLLGCHQASPGKAFILGYLWGGFTHLFILRWIFIVPGFGFFQALPLTLSLGIYGAIWCTGLAISARKKISLILFAPCLWVVLEYLKHHAGFLALPLASLAQTQYQNVWLLQVASWTGEYGLSFCLIMVNCALVEILVGTKRGPVTLVLVLVTFLHLSGYFRLQQQECPDTIRIGVVQPCIFRSERVGNEARDFTLDRLTYYTKRAVAENAEVVVWPETAVRDIHYDHGLRARIIDLVDTINVPLVTGSAEFEKFSHPTSGQTGGLTIDKKYYNSVFFIQPQQPITEPYRKIVLVPFAEYLPLENTIHWPEWLVRKSFGITAGSGPRNFQLSDGTNLTPLICWESLFSDVVRQVAKDHCSIIILVTNDNWFGLSAAAQQHNSTAVFRAVETGRPVVISSNCGPSLSVDHLGRIGPSLTTLFGEGVLISQVRKNCGDTFYLNYGDLFVCAAASLLLVLLLGRGLIRALSRINDNRNAV